MTVDEMIARWNSPEGHPYKGSLIDWSRYGGDGDEPPADIGCMCAQGQALHLLGGWSPAMLRDSSQDKADRETAKLLGISVTHAVLLRQINDTIDGAPAIVLTHPERALGDQAPTLLKFWRHLDTVDWAAAGNAARAAAWNAAGNAARAAAWNAARAAAGDAAGDAAWNAARAAAWASNEIQGAEIMRERGQSFFFLPIFGFVDPESVITQ